MDLLKRVVILLGATCMMFANAGLLAAEQGDFVLRVGGAWVIPNDDSDSVEGIPGSRVDVEDNLTFGFTVGYMLTDHFAVELLGVTPTSHDLEGDGSISALGRIGETEVFPPTLSVQYHPLPDYWIRPYIGVGVNYTHFRKERASSSLETALGGRTSIELDDSWGPAGHAGFDVTLKDDWFVGFTAWYIHMETEATLKTNGVRRDVDDVEINPWVLLLSLGRSF